MVINLKEEKQKMEVRDLFLKIFQEDGISEEDLKQGIYESYVAEGFKCKSFEDIPLNEMEIAILDCYKAGGLEFNNINEVLEHNRNK